MIHNFTKNMSQYPTVTAYWKDRANNSERVFNWLETHNFTMYTQGDHVVVVNEDVAPRKGVLGDSVWEAIENAIKEEKS